MQRIEASSVSLPKGGGAIKGIGESFQANIFSGAASYSIPVPLSPARGFVPQLNLNYSSGSGSGTFGMGMSLSLSSIIRKTSTGIPKYNGKDTFILSDEGELTPQLNEHSGQLMPDIKTVVEAGISWSVHTYLPRVTSAYSLIEQWCDTVSNTSWWKVTSRNNITAIYGKNPVARIADPENASKIFEWLIEQSFDSKGNKILYHYKTEDGKNIANQVYEVNRQLYAKKYIQSIQYGPYLADTKTMAEQFAFEVVFDYGEYDLTQLEQPDSKPYIPIRDWAERSDSFSSYRSGFEIRTFRLCRNILVFHNFKELDSEPCLVKMLQMTHTATPSFSFVDAITQIGLRRKTDGSYTLQSLPSLEFEYSDFSPTAAPAFEPLYIDKDHAIPGYLERGSFNAIDLNGEGLPGLLISNDSTTLYFEPTGNGAYQAPIAPTSFPITKNFSNPRFSLQSLEGNGQMDLVVNSTAMNGFYSQEYDGNWSAFRAFTSVPTDIASPYRVDADLSGTGKTDLLICDKPKPIFYPSKGKDGYDSADSAILQDGFPIAVDNGESALVTFANVFGDGLSHRLKISNGSVEVWPNLGYGKFGKKIILGNAPQFDITTTVSRIFLADVDGSGTTDLVFVYPDRVDIFLNRAGNSFAEKPVSIYVPGGFGNSDQIQFADILGTGTAALVLTKVGAPMQHWYYNFCGVKKDHEFALKPYLLTSINNNIGVVTDFYYASSTKFYLQDKKAGKPWKTRLPFPVQVVEKTVVSDSISGSRLSSRYRYHEGYYDPTEKEFRGFGFVESWDTESFEDYTQSTSNPDFPAERLNKELFVPPVYTKTWHHTGAFFENEIITKQYAQEYFNGDKAAYDFPDSVFDPKIYQTDPETVRQAYVALKGTVMRQEVYALDNSEHQEFPYTVTESNVEVTLVQAKAEQQYAVFRVSPRESINYHYERNPEDPRVQQEFTLQVDTLCGEVKKSCTVFLPRRSVSTLVYPEQKALTVTANAHDYINTADTENYRFRGIVYQSQEFEIFGLDLAGKKYCSFDNALPITSAIDNPIPYQAPVTFGIQARQLLWDKIIFWNEGQTDVMALGEISSRALLHHNESAVFTDAFVTDVFGPQLSLDTVQSLGGYFFDTESGYWWNKGLAQHYFDQTQIAAYYQPCRTENSFIDPSSSLFAKSTVEYDQPYYFSPVKVTQYIDETNSDPDQRANTLTALTDYITLQPYQLVDINNNVSQVLFDPLGQVIVTSLFGTENDKPKGGMRLYPYNGLPAEYISQDQASFNNVLMHPEQYLQGACSYFYYNLLNWKEHEQPLSAINLQRDAFYHPEPGLSDFACTISISYSDGLGRTLESKVQMEDRWIVSGRTVYNNKGKPCEQYLPYFTDIPDYEIQEDIVDKNLTPPPSVTHYDPLLRIIRIDTPKGYFSKVKFSPWEETHYDENDTVIDSCYYINFFDTYPENPNQQQIDEKDALLKAAKFYNTPAISVMDNIGKPVRTIENNLGNVTQAEFQDIVKGSAVTADELFNELINKNYLVSNSSAPIGTWVTDKFQPYAENFVLNLDVAYQPFSEAIIVLLKQNGLMSFIQTDAQGRTTLTIDPRLYYSNQTTDKEYYNFKYRYAMAEEKPVIIDSVDAGVQKHLCNIYGNQLWSLSARNYCQLISYDRLQRRVGLFIKKLDNEQPITSYANFNQVEVFEYGETQRQAQNKNLRGEVCQLKDLSGIVINSQYSLLGKLLETSRQMATDFKTPIAWNSAIAPSLEKEIYSSQFSYNALNQLITETTPDNSITTNTYNPTGLLNRVNVLFSDKSEQQVIQSIQYDAHGQRETIQYGNGITTHYSYESTTLNLIRLLSTRIGTPVETVQDINYTYDPIGNITRSWNNTFKTVFNSNQQIDPLSDYSYDALYRLIKANGRQHLGINANTFQNNIKDGDFKQSIFSQLPNINDSDKLENYSENYSYDDSGNLIKKAHKAASVSWNKETPVEDNSNHLKNLEYDASGNLRKLDINNTVSLAFNCCENLVSAGIISRPDELDDCDYYVYDSNELRTRKVSERMASGGAVTLIEEKIYVGNYEIKRNKTVNANGAETTTMERQTLRIMDGQSCVLTRNNCVIGDEPGQKLRFQMGDNLGSITAEYDKDAQLISYEEYFPYGGTAIIAGANQAEVKLKDYRYSGKECDDSTGLYYYGARYYAPWLGRWLNPDPAGTVDGMNIYAFVGGNPITNIDGNGMMLRSTTGYLFRATPIRTQKLSRMTMRHRSSVRLFHTDNKPRLTLTPKDLIQPMKNVAASQALFIPYDKPEIIRVPSLVYCRACLLGVHDKFENLVGHSVFHYEGRNENHLMDEIMKPLKGILETPKFTLLRYHHGADQRVPDSDHPRPGFDMDQLTSEFLKSLVLDMGVKSSEITKKSDEETLEFMRDYDDRSRFLKFYHAMMTFPVSTRTTFFKVSPNGVVSLNLNARVEMWFNEKTVKDIKAKPHNPTSL